MKIFFAFIGSFFFLSCASGYKQNVKGMSGEKFCLDINETQKRNSIEIGKGTLVLNEDKTFEITNDSLKFSNIKGDWDLCCGASDWGNYMFRSNNHIRQMSSLPEFEVKIEDRIYFLVFSSCK